MKDVDDGKLGLKLNSSPDVNSSDEEDAEENYNDCIIKSAGMSCTVVMYHTGQAADFPFIFNRVDIHNRRTAYNYSTK